MVARNADQNRDDPFVMPIELQIIRAREFVRLGAHGRFNLKASIVALAKLAAACRKRGINQALMDVRDLHPGVKPVFSPNDLAVLVSTFLKIGFTRQQRLAVLYRVDPHHRARIFAFFAKMRGWRVQAFDGFEEAVTWLFSADSEQSETETEYTPKAKKIPVRKLNRLKAESKPAFPPVPIKSILASDASQLKAGKRLAEFTRAIAVPVSGQEESIKRK
jgi:hypothetical protein